MEDSRSTSQSQTDSPRVSPARPNKEKIIDRAGGRGQKFEAERKEDGGVEGECI